MEWSLGAMECLASSQNPEEAVGPMLLLYCAPCRILIALALEKTTTYFTVTSAFSLFHASRALEDQEPAGAASLPPGEPASPRTTTAKGGVRRNSVEVREGIRQQPSVWSHAWSYLD